MRRAVALSALIALILPVSPTLAKPAVPGRSITLTVKGVPKGSKARILLKGPKDTVVRARGIRKVRHLKPGSYRVVPKKLVVSGSTWTGRATPKRVKVTKRKGARVRVVYTRRSTTPPPDNDDLPATPFPQTLSPSSITLVSRTPTGSAGDKHSNGPAWSPDGRSVAFSSCATNLGGASDVLCHLFTSSVGDGAVSRLSNTSMDDINDWGGEPAWSPDGTHLAFTTMRRLVPADTDTNKDVYTVTTAGTDVRRVSQTQAGADMQGAPAAAHDPQWSPDGAAVLFTASATNLGPGQGDIYVKRLGDGTLVRTGAGERSAGARWSTDSRIGFTAGSDVFDPALDDWSRSYDVFTVASTGGAVTAVTGDHGVFGAPTWSPAGALAFSTTSALVSSDTNEARDIYDTGGARVSTGPGGEQSLWDATSPVWSPDGRKVAYVASGSGPSTILVKDLISGSVTQLVDPTHGTTCQSQDYDEESGETYCSQYRYFEAVDPVWSPDSTRLAFVADYPNLVVGDGNGTDDVFIATL